MGSWHLTSFRLDPWSYQNLLLKRAVLAETNTTGSPVSKAAALRYILRRLRFTDEQKKLYLQKVRGRLVEKGVELP